MINRLAERTARRLTRAVALTLTLCLMAGGVMPAQATEPPEMPHQFYGTVSFDGSPVEEGTLVEAFVNDVKQAETTVDDESRYGYDTIFRVPGTAGATVITRILHFMMMPPWSVVPVRQETAPEPHRRDRQSFTASGT